MRLLLLLLLLGCCCSCTAAGATRFLVLGDWGTPEVSKVAPHLLRELNSADTAAVLLVGDNFYPPYHKPHQLDHQQQADTIRQVYEQPFRAFPSHVPFQVVAGNHDHYFNLSAELAHKDARWYFPAPYYARAYGNNEVLTLNLDTYALVGGESSSSQAGAHVVDTQQLEWLERELRERAHLYAWVVVVGHYPIFSCHKGGDTGALKTGLLPLLRKYRVDAYLSGHIHVLQHLTTTSSSDDELHMFVSGNGARYLSDVEQCELGRKRSRGDDATVVLGYADNTYGFLSLDVADSEMLVKFHAVSLDGKEHRVVYEASVQKKHHTSSSSLRQVLLDRLRAGDS